MAETEIIIRPQQKSAAENSASAGGAAKNLLTAENAPENTAGAKSAPKTEEARAVLAQAAELLQSPQDYIFHFAPETAVDEALVDEFRRFAFEQKMSLENARLMAKFYETYVQNQSKKQSREQAELLQAMCRACEEDGEYGGTGFHDNMRYARAAILRFDDGSLAKILNETGFGSHPEVVRFMYRVGRALAEKDMPSAGRAKPERSAAELFYPSMRRA